MKNDSTHQWLDVGSAGAAVLSGGLFVVGSYAASPIVMTIAAGAGLAGVIGRLAYMRQDPPPPEGEKPKFTFVDRPK